jgi:hypothetical protein
MFFPTGSENRAQEVIEGTTLLTLQNLLIQKGLGFASEDFERDTGGLIVLTASITFLSFNEDLSIDGIQVPFGNVPVRICNTGYPVTINHMSSAVQPWQRLFCPNQIPVSIGNSEWVEFIFQPGNAWRVKL